MIATERKPKSRKRTTRSESAEAYAKRLAWQTEKNRQATASHRDFGKLPKIGDPKRKVKAKKSLRFFCETYLAATFDRPWSPDHLDVIEKLERSIRKGGLFALAMPRGSGKTSLAEAAGLWALLFGFRRFVMLIGATEPLAENMLNSIRQELESNDLLLEDFPAICLPLRRLEGVTTRRLLCNGNRVKITLTAKSIILPWIYDARAAVGAGSILAVRGITGAIRGAKEKLPTGETIRPDFVILDDPQTDESAKSPAQVAAREKVLKKAVLGLAGPGKKIAACAPVTVIEEGDLADRLLTPELNPEWNGSRIPFVKSFPERMDLWDAYAELRVESLREHGDIRKATKFYKANRKAMDAGAVVSWESRFEEDELSAIQHAMNRKLADEAAFWAEMQNDPRESADDDVRLQSAKVIATRTNGLPRLEAISGTQTITGFIDVQKKALFYGLVGWKSDFSGSVIDYGTFPDQGRKYFNLADVNKTLSKQYPGQGVEGSITSGLGELVSFLTSRPYVRENDGAELSPSLILVDANWQTSTVREFCRRLRSTSIIPSHGRFVGASSKPMTEHQKKKGERLGLNWKSSAIERLTHILFDTNFWKSFIHERLGVAFGDSGNLTFYGSEPTAHRMLAENLTAEYRVRVENQSTGRTVDEWKHKASKPDNHFLDVLVGCAVAASIMGCSLRVAGGDGEGVPRRRKRRRRRVSYS